MAGLIAEPVAAGRREREQHIPRKRIVVPGKSHHCYSGKDALRLSGRSHRGRPLT